MRKRCSMCKTLSEDGHIVYGRLETMTGFEIAPLFYWVCDETCEQALRTFHKPPEQEKREAEQLRHSLAGILADMS